MFVYSQQTQVESVQVTNVSRPHRDRLSGLRSDQEVPVAPAGGATASVPALAALAALAVVLCSSCGSTAALSC